MVHISTAPPLGGITKRRTKEWLYKYTKNSSKMFVEGDSIAIALRNQKSKIGGKFDQTMTLTTSAVLTVMSPKTEEGLIAHGA